MFLPDGVPMNDLKKVCLYEKSPDDLQSHNRPFTDGEIVLSTPEIWKNPEGLGVQE